MPEYWQSIASCINMIHWSNHMKKHLMRRNCMGTYISKLTIFGKSQQNQTCVFHQTNQLLPVSEKSSDAHACHWFQTICWWWQCYLPSRNIHYQSSLLKGFLIWSALHEAPASVLYLQSCHTLATLIPFVEGWQTWGSCKTSVNTHVLIILSMTSATPDVEHPDVHVLEDTSMF